MVEDVRSAVDLLSVDNFLSGALVVHTNDKRIGDKPERITLSVLLIGELGASRFEVLGGQRTGLEVAAASVEERLAIVHIRGKAFHQSVNGLVKRSTLGSDCHGINHSRDVADVVVLNIFARNVDSAFELHRLSDSDDATDDARAAFGFELFHQTEAIEGFDNFHASSSVLLVIENPFEVVLDLAESFLKAGIDVARDCVERSLRDIHSVILLSFIISRGRKSR